ISLIPSDALDRVEVLTDGASSIYGADAVGGVVNFVPRHLAAGPEGRAHFGDATSGGFHEGGGSLSDGAHWSSGEAFISGSLQGASALQRRSRDFSRDAGAGDLSPTDQRASLVGNFSLAFSPSSSVSGDMLLSGRNVKTQFVLLGASEFV